LRLADNGKKKKQKKNVNSFAEEFDDLEDFSDLAGLAGESDETSSQSDPASSVLQKRSLSDIISNLEGRKQKDISADQNVPYRNLEASREVLILFCEMMCVLHWLTCRE